MNPLPEGWIDFSLSQIGGLVGGKTPSKSNPQFWTNGCTPWVSPKDMKRFDLTSSEDQISNAAVTKAGMELLPQDSILIVTRSGILAHTLPVAIARMPVTINQDIKAIRPFPIFHPRYMAYNVLAHNRIILNNCAKAGTTVASVSTSLLERLPLPLAPLPEQKRIADKLDTVLARVDACRERLNRVSLILKRFRQSVLADAMCGKLTADWRESSIDKNSETTSITNASIKSPLVIFEDDQVSLPIGWQWKKLTSLAKLESGHTPRKSIPEYWENGTVPWISLQDIRLADGKEIFETKYMPTVLGIQNSSARLLPKGTVCFCRDISFGYVAIMGKEMSTTQHFANWICSESLVPKYLMYAFMAGRDFLAMSGQGTTVTTIYMPALKELRIATAPTEEQIEIVRRVEKLLAFADRLENRLATASATTECLTPALLAKAFRGELVPQDPNDEPAAELLKRLAAARESAPKGKRNSRSNSTVAEKA